ncbi:procathepsin L-like [Anthonomus grandis grandis]|uniref:procathepsin L-like n=1 Tax=Anthonomus grandis grandis TaxID=2921223 RepID=UPI00216565A4|nr:procathepsin L-like [Anthonomus grandis grandis]
MYFKSSVLFFVLLSAPLLCAQNHTMTFKVFQASFNKTYQPTELTLREQVFNQNLQKIEEHNKKFDLGLVAYKTGVNSFTDLTEEEFLARFKTLPLEESFIKANSVQDSNQFNISELPKSIDWREKGVVTAVKDQGSCGGCWAFSATGTLEGQLAINTGNLTSLSEQELIDCNTATQKGCNGGVVQYALSYVIENGITSEENYPYVGEQKSCKSKRNAVRADSYVNIRSYNETDLKLAVGFVGPVSVAVNAYLLKDYESGIINSPCLDDVDHGVLVVGYGTDNKTNLEYWIIKNSWGSEWGESGYYKLALGKQLCGIAKQACYPVGVRNSAGSLSFSIMAGILMFFYLL